MSPKFFSYVIDFGLKSLSRTSDFSATTDMADLDHPKDLNLPDLMDMSTSSPAIMDLADPNHPMDLIISGTEGVPQIVPGPDLVSRNTEAALLLGHGDADHFRTRNLSSLSFCRLTQPSSYQKPLKNKSDLFLQCPAFNFRLHLKLLPHAVPSVMRLS